MSITYIPPRVPSVEGFLKEDGTVPLTGIWDTGNHNIIGPSAIYTSSTAPLSPYTGMLWNDTSIASRKMIRSWNGTAWGVVSGYETSSRTISLIHDHGALLTASDLSSTWNDVGKNGAVLITIEIDNKTYKTFEAGAAVDAGGGLVKLPIASGHGFVAGERVCIDGTVNYDDVFVVDSVEETYIIIPATYVSETIPADAVIRVVIENGILFGFNTNSITVTAKGYSSATKTQKQRVVIYNNVSSARPYFGSLLRETHVNGIKVHAVNSIGFQEASCNSIFFESCAVSGNISKAAISLSQGGSGAVRYLSIKNAAQGILASYGTSVVSFECKSIANVNYGLYAFWGGTIIKASTQQPTGSTANEFTSYGGLIR